MMIDYTRQFVLYLIRYAKRPLAKTALLKLVYLADVEHYRRTGQPLTSAHWKRDQRGPVAYEILRMEEQLAKGNHVIMDSVTAYDKTYEVYRANPKSSMLMGEEWCEYADFVIEHYSHLPLREILKIAYATEPMLPDPPNGQDLDMSLIRPYLEPNAAEAVYAAPLSAGERERILRSGISSFAIENIEVPREVAERALDEALRKPLPDIGS